MEIKVIVATHKKCKVPEDKMYMPLHVGKEGKEDIGFDGDNTGENISKKNPNFCELTGLYWLWKNDESDFKGLVHYRRYFKGKGLGKDKWSHVLTRDAAEKLLRTKEMILTKKQHYFIETIYSHYIHTHHKRDLDETRLIIKEIFPEYLSTFDRVMKKRSAHMFNMFITNREICSKYCDWLFTILFELENRIDISSYSPFEARVFGRISELLLDVWVNKNQISYCEVPCIYMGNVNWLKKGIGFLKAKFLKKGYKESF